MHESCRFHAALSFVPRALLKKQRLIHNKNGHVSLFSQTEKCNPNVDVAFLIDSSGSISGRNYRKVKTFVANLAANFNISPGGSRAAVVLYSTGASTDIKFTDFTSSESFGGAVQRLTHQRGFTRIDLALQRAYYDLFSPRGDSRYDVPKIAFLLTDGEQTPSPDAIPLDRAARFLKNEGVRLITIGIGKNVKEAELKSIASSEKDVMLADTFDGLLEEVEPLTKSACEGFACKFPPKYKHIFVVLMFDSYNN